ncbi:MAG: hypothetical protein ACK5MZ_05730 [Aestuariibaculum sp.]
MKNFKFILGTVLLAAITFTGCSDNDDNEEPDVIRPTAEEFSEIRENALDNITQNFEFNTGELVFTATSENGVEITIYPGCLTLNGEAVTGTVKLEYVEIFERGNMITTNKPTMGIMPNGDKALLITGGEFFLNLTQNDQALETNCSFLLKIPTELTGGENTGMTLWEGVIDEDGNLAWEELREDNQDTDQKDGVFIEGTEYYAFRGEFGWTNVDIFYNDPREKTTLLVAVPDGYDKTNCAIYLSYNDQKNALALLDTYDSNTKLFSEHYGQIPIGLECNAIFITEDGDNWKYAVKAVTIEENGTITFTESEMSTVTESQLITIINNLP